ncbi:hypothetical protein ACU18_14740 [Arthrobacter sp. ZBG10]|uniref:hypothetical protein n=1 Tax=unclassified Arthrobacter TaxID=235627 RepID=UPI0006834331|nr:MULTISPECIES: hypothetical protein [unclassified Arthrobacter]KNH16105.1 hypothetical protein ACU18_14740 [Arthrobacter sp. ZBG10]
MKLKPAAAMAILTVPLLLGGCAGDGSGIAALTTPAGPEDELPSDAHFQFPEHIDATTLRFLVEDNGRQFFAAQSTDGAQACLAVVNADGHVTDYAGCAAAAGSSSNKIVTVTGSDRRPAVLVRDNADAAQLESEGLKRVHQNVYVGK